MLLNLQHLMYLRIPENNNKEIRPFFVYTLHADEWEIVRGELEKLKRLENML